MLKHRNLLKLQVSLWIFSAVLFYLRYKMPGYTRLYIASITIWSFAIYALIIYGYIHLYNLWFSRLKPRAFALRVGLLFAGVVILKISGENSFVGMTSVAHSRLFYSDLVIVSTVHLANAFASCFFVLLTAILFKSFTETLALRARQAEIQQKHIEAELKQLKMHVQPHFLFNSLNNLYYDIYKTLPGAADRVERLSDIMRYFMEESPKVLVPFSTEMEFIEDYIQLEQVRFPQTILVDLKKDEEKNPLLPPMLLIPLVENVFKHGLRPELSNTSIHLHFHFENDRLFFSTRNKLLPVQRQDNRPGTGLKNLSERLQLLYNGKYSLRTFEEGGEFVAQLTIPVYEN